MPFLSHVEARDRKLKSGEQDIQCELNEEARSLQLKTNSPRRSYTQLLQKNIRCCAEGWKTCDWYFGPHLCLLDTYAKKFPSKSCIPKQWSRALHPMIGSPLLQAVRQWVRLQIHPPHCIPILLGRERREDRHTSKQ